jgi:hypothetical protein
LAIWRIFRRSPLSEEKYPNRNPAWKQALLIIDFQGFTRKGSSTSLSVAGLFNRMLITPLTLHNSHLVREGFPKTLERPYQGSKQSPEKSIVPQGLFLLGLKGFDVLTR